MTDLLHRRPRLHSQLGVVLIARFVEQALCFRLRQTLNKARLAHGRFAAAFDDLGTNPFEVLERGVAPWQKIHRILDSHRAESLKPPADLHPQVIRLWWDMVNQKEPSALRSGRRLACTTFRIDRASSLARHSRVHRATDFGNKSNCDPCKSRSLIARSLGRRSSWREGVSVGYSKRSPCSSERSARWPTASRKKQSWRFQE